MVQHEHSVQSVFVQSIDLKADDDHRPAFRVSIGGLKEGVMIEMGPGSEGG